MNVTPTAIPEVMLVEPAVFHDTRGFFFESFNQRAFEAAIGVGCRFVQDNHSHSRQGVLRGLHYQLPPHEQGRLVRVVRGVVWDVAVDIRMGSATFGKWVGVELSEVNQHQLWIPAGFAHGFVVLSECADVVYKTTEYYNPAAERGIAWNDPRLAIAWPRRAKELLLSDKDRRWPGLDSLYR